MCASLSRALSLKHPPTSIVPPLNEYERVRSALAKTDDGIDFTVDPSPRVRWAALRRWQDGGADLQSHDGFVADYPQVNKRLAQGDPLVALMQVKCLLARGNKHAVECLSTSLRCHPSMVSAALFTVLRTPTRHGFPALADSVYPLVVQMAQQAVTPEEQLQVVLLLYTATAEQARGVMQRLTIKVPSAVLRLALLRLAVIHDDKTIWDHVKGHLPASSESERALATLPWLQLAPRAALSRLKQLVDLSGAQSHWRKRQAGAWMRTLMLLMPSTVMTRRARQDHGWREGISLALAGRGHSRKRWTQLWTACKDGWQQEAYKELCQQPRRRREGMLLALSVVDAPLLSPCPQTLQDGLTADPYLLRLGLTHPNAYVRRHVSEWLNMSGNVDMATWRAIADLPAARLPCRQLLSVPMDAADRIIVSTLSDDIGHETSMEDLHRYAICSQHNAELRRRLQAYLQNAPADRVASILASVPLKSLWGMQRVLLDTWRQRIPEAFVALAAGEYDSANAAHRLAAMLKNSQTSGLYRRAMNTPYVSGASFNLRLPDAQLDRKEQLRRKIAGSMSVECQYLAYESYLLEKKILKPLSERARALNLPVLVIANLSCGATALTAFKSGDWRRHGMRYVEGKHGSHNSDLDFHLLSPEDLEFVVTRRPLVLVIDTTESDHFPRAFSNYRIYVKLLNEALGTCGQMPQFSALTWEDDFGQGAATRKNESHLPEDVNEIVAQHASLKTSGYDFFITSSTPKDYDAGTVLRPFLWDDVLGPAFICVHPGISPADIALDPSWAAQITRAAGDGVVHNSAFFDDDDHQTPEYYRGKRGYPKIASPFHGPTRAFFKYLQHEEGLRERESQLLPAAPLGSVLTGLEDFPVSP